jgi:hypothetical protein
MSLKKTTIEELKRIMTKDYHIKLTDEEASELGLSLLRLTRISIITTAQEISMKAKDHQIQEILEPNKEREVKDIKSPSMSPI